MVAFGWMLTVFLVVTAVLTASPEGRILSGIATIAIGLYTLFGTVARPRLCADEQGIQVRGLTGRSRWTWAQVSSVRVARTRRFGRNSALLELDLVDADGDEHLIVLGWLDLGTDPQDVAEALRARRP